MEIDGKCGKRRKQRKTSEMSELDLVQTLRWKGAENVGKQWKMSERSELELVEIWYMTPVHIYSTNRQRKKKCNERKYACQMSDQL